MERYLQVTMPDGSIWEVPVLLVAENYAKWRTSRGVETSAAEVLQGMDDDDVMDWAANNMDWSDVRENAVMIKPADSVDFDEGWVNGEKRVICR